MHGIFRIGLIASVLAPSAWGWGCDGHQIVALVARAHLTPAVSAAVDDLLRANPIDAALRRFCPNRPDDLMADSATWADDFRNQAKNGPWHYVDIPRNVISRTALDSWCPSVGPSVDGKDATGCVVNVIGDQVAILRDKGRSAADRAMALRYVIHFLGDIHQPLHDIDNDDQGGNCTSITFDGEERLTNLHSIWDSKLIQREMQTDKLTDAGYAAALDQRFASKSEELAKEKVDDPATWAWESNALARSVAYGNLEPAIPVETPNKEMPAPQSVCDAERAKVTALHITIAGSYFDKATPVVDEQLATAGFRLALLLNAVFRPS